MKKNNTAEKTILEVEKLSEALKEGTQNSLKDIMNEAINRFITESEDGDDEDKFEVEDVDTEEIPSSDDTCCKDGECMNDTEEGDKDDDDWSDMEEYKVGDNDYDFTGVEGDDILKVYNKLGDDDQIFVKKDEDGNYEVKDEETGAEYVIELNADPDESDEAESDFGDEDNEIEIEMDSDSEPEDTDDEIEFEFGDDDDNENEEDDEMLNETELGYTNTYQDDVMPGLNMNEPANPKATYSMDGGVPKGNKRPYSGYEKKDGDPFKDEVSEGLDENPAALAALGGAEGGALAGFADGMAVGGALQAIGNNGGENESAIEEGMIDEAGESRGQVQRRSTAKSYVQDNDSPDIKNTRNASKKGEKVNGTERPISESFVRAIVSKAKQIQNENKQYEDALAKIKVSLKEAAVLNVNLAQIVKLLSENTTNASEKKSIVERFSGVKTIKESKMLYDTIKRELSSNGNSTVMLEQQISANGSNVLNETTMYQNTESNPSLDLMNRLDNLYK